MKRRSERCILFHLPRCSPSKFVIADADTATTIIHGAGEAADYQCFPYDFPHPLTIITHSTTQLLIIFLSRVSLLCALLLVIILSLSNMERIVDEILNTAEWQWAADAESSRRSTTSKVNNLKICRRAVIARHVKLAELIGTVGEINSFTVKQDHQCTSPESWRKTAPFHPLHCAASQGMLEDGMFLWEEAANSQVRK